MNRLGQFLIGLWKDESGGSIGRLVLGAAGAAIGFYFGGIQGAQIGFLVGSAVGSAIFPEDLPDIQGSKLDPISTVSSYGSPIAIGYGRFVTGGVMAYYPGFVEHEVTTENESGKSAPTQKQISYSYTGSFRINFAEGPIQEFVKLWANRTLIYDASNVEQPILDLERLNEAPGVNAIRFYLGGETQLPDPTEQADKGLNATPAYRGLAGVFFQNYPLDDTGGRVPQWSALMSTDTSEILPVTVIPNASGSVNWEWQPGKQTFLTGPSIRVDNQSQSILKSGGFGGAKPDFPCVDMTGDFYRIREGFGDPQQLGARVSKIDGTTLLEVQESERLRDPLTLSAIGHGGLDFDKGRVFGGIKTSTGKWIGQLLYVQTAAIDSAIVISVDDLDSATGGVIQYYKLGRNPIPTHVGTLVVDNNRELWTCTGSGLITRIGAGAGEIQETFATGETVTDLSYDPVTNSLILGNSSVGLKRWNIDTESIDGSLARTYHSSHNFANFWNGPTSDGRFYLQLEPTLGTFREVNIQTMTVRDRTWRPDEWGLDPATVHRGMFDESRNAVMKSGGGVNYLYIDKFTSNLITVKTIVDDIADRIGITSAMRETGNLTQQLHGYLIQRRLAANSALEPLRRFFFFNPIVEDFIVKFPLLGTASVATIPEDDLAAGDDDTIRTPVDRVVEQQINELTLPEVIELTYAGEFREYQAQVQRAKRPKSTTNARRKRLMSFPGTFATDADASQRLEQLLYQVWTKRRPITIRTSQKWMKLSPADVIKVQANSVEHTMIIGTIDIGANNVLEIRGTADDPKQLISFATGLGGDIPDQVIVLTGVSELFLLDIPLLRDADDGFGIYIAGGPFGDSIGFPGQEVLRSSDDVTYGPYSFIGKNRAVDHGFVVGTMADAPDNDPNVWDRVTSLDVTLNRGTLASSSEALVLDGANSILIGKEIVAFVTATDNGGGDYTLDTFLRGRLGTEGEMANHVLSEKVVLLSEDTLVRVADDTSVQNIVLFYKGVTRGGSFENALRKVFTIVGKSQWTWAPVHVFGSIASSDWTINWEWRNRLGSRWRDLVGMNSPGTFDYEVDVLDAPGGAVLATYTSTATGNGSVITATSHQFFYDDADQTVDFGSPQTTLTVKIYPINVDSSLGRGFPTEKTLVGG